MQELINLRELQRLQDKFAELGHFFVYCVDEEGRKISDMSGPPAEIEIIEKSLDKEQFYNMFCKVRNRTLDDCIIENTSYSNVKVAAIAYKIQGKPILCWLACYVLSGQASDMGEATLEGVFTTTTDESFAHFADLFHMIAADILNARIPSFLMEKELRKAEVFAQMVQLLESAEAFEKVGKKMLQIVGEYLDVTSTQLLHVAKDGQSIDVFCEWLNKNVISEYDDTKGLKRPEILNGDTPVIVKSFLSMPLMVKGNIDMYWTFREKNQDRFWDTDEIQFINDMTKILQSILTRRTQKQSLINSFASLQMVLDNVGSSILVMDAEGERVLFVNKVMKKTFQKELEKDEGAEFYKENLKNYLSDGYYEICYEKEQRWYDLFFTHITWVDGDEVALYAMFDVTEKKVYQQKIEQLAYVDFLTGLYNRMCCERDLAREIDRAKESGECGGLLYMDLDDFKHINDGLGHQQGDILLKNISSKVSSIAGIEDSCYRMGGDEFVIIVPTKSYGRFEQIIDEIKDIFSRPWFLKDAHYYCTMSMGIVTFPDDGDNVEDLIRRADIAMYEAKKTGKNRYARYSDSMTSISNKRLDMEKNMRDAAMDCGKEFEIYYQPIIDIRQEGGDAIIGCTGAEALLRWDSRAMGFIAPSDFIPLAEYLGLINPIGNYVLLEACKACKYWNDNGKDNFKVNVNLSVVQLLQNNIVEIVEEALQKSGVNPQNLTLEVTESLAINDMTRMKEILTKIRGLGVRIALDDFGTGYSSLNHIKELPLDVIKVDQKFVKDLAEDGYSQSFIKMVGELAMAIDVNVCVEGIETKRQLKVLEGMQVQLVQGYHFDKPLPREEFEEKYL